MHLIHHLHSHKTYLEDPFGLKILLLSNGIPLPYGHCYYGKTKLGEDTGNKLGVCKCTLGWAWSCNDVSNVVDGEKSRNDISKISRVGKIQPELETKDWNGKIFSW